jgi:hypothetical protein
VLKSKEANFMHGGHSFIAKENDVFAKNAGCAAGVEKKQGESCPFCAYGST